MKTAIYIENGVTQIVLTPETAWEKTALESLKEGRTFKVKRGAFYECQGGWHRHGADDRSIMIITTEEV